MDGVLSFPTRSALSEREQKTHDIITHWWRHGDPVRIDLGRLFLMLEDFGFELDEELKDKLLEDLREIQKKI